MDKKDKRIEELEEQLYWTEKSMDLTISFVKHSLCERIRERYNLNHEKRIEDFGDCSYGYAMISADDLNKFLYELENR